MFAKVDRMFLLSYQRVRRYINKFYLIVCKYTTDCCVGASLLALHVHVHDDVCDSLYVVLMTGTSPNIGGIR